MCKVEINNIMIIYHLKSLNIYKYTMNMTTISTNASMNSPVNKRKHLYTPICGSCDSGEWQWLRKCTECNISVCDGCYNELNDDILCYKCYDAISCKTCNSNSLEWTDNCTGCDQQICNNCFVEVADNIADTPVLYCTDCRSDDGCLKCKRILVFTENYCEVCEKTELCCTCGHKKSIACGNCTHSLCYDCIKHVCILSDDTHDDYLCCSHCKDKVLQGV